MKYKLIGIRPTHDDMFKMVGEPLYRINNDSVEKVYITDIRIGKNYKWEFVFTGEETFKENEPLFISIKSVKRYLKKKGINILGY